MGTGSEGHIWIAEGITGTGTSVVHDPAKNFHKVKAPKPSINLAFNSKLKNSAQHRSRLTGDVKFTEGYKVQNGLLEAQDINTFTDWVIAAYIAKNPIYLIVKFKDSGGSWINKSWWNKLTKVYYCQGVFKTKSIKQKEGQIWDIQFDFKEVWNT